MLPNKPGIINWKLFRSILKFYENNSQPNKRVKNTLSKKDNDDDDNNDENDANNKKAPSNIPSIGGTNKNTLLKKDNDDDMNNVNNNNKASSVLNTKNKND